MTDEYKPEHDIDTVTVGSVKGDKQPIEESVPPRKPKIVLNDTSREGK